MEIYKKLQKFQNSIKPIKKDGTVSFKNTRFKYATLGNLEKNIRPLLTELGMMYSFTIQGNLITVFVLDLESGERVTSSLELKETNDPKILGSNITYYKRYLLTSILGITVDDDNSEQQQRQKAKLNNKQFEQAVAKIKKGEKDVTKQLLLYFELTNAQQTELLLLENE